MGQISNFFKSSNLSLGPDFRLLINIFDDDDDDDEIAKLLRLKKKKSWVGKSFRPIRPVGGGGERTLGVSFQGVQ